MVDGKYLNEIGFEGVVDAVRKTVGQSASHAQNHFGSSPGCLLYTFESRFDARKKFIIQAGALHTVPDRRFTKISFGLIADDQR